jgi:hypothetical protein
MRINDVKREHLTRIMSTGVNMPGKTAPHLVYFSTEKVSPREMHSEASACFLHQESSIQVHRVPLF